ncbi:MAG: LysR family transcriptional regulator [Sebaldella sp.]|nr:LysR family transcriptional regulator [Sebaldella sp.]
MNERKLKIFFSVSETLNMTKTSKEMFISQSAVSQTIKELENELGVILFERMYKKLYLTEDGKLLKEYARRLLNLWNDMTEHMQSKKKNVLIKVGGSTTIGIYLLPYLCKSFSISYPDVNFNIQIDNTTKVIQKVLENEIDIGIIEGTKPSNSEELISLKTQIDYLKVITPNIEKFKNKEIFTISDFQNEILILRETGSGTREVVDKYIEELEIKVKNKLVIGNTEAIKKMVEIGLGISIISQLAIESEVLDEKLLSFKIENYEMNREFSIIIHKDKFISSTLESFIKLIKSM